jgi:O-antigen/teichoic acid export membrane protein
LRRLYVDGTRVLLVVLATVAVISWFWSADFYRIWLGTKYADILRTGSPAMLFGILLVGLVGTFAGGMGGQILLGTLRVRTLACLSASQALVNLLLNLYLIQSWGLLGVAVGSAVCPLVFRSLLIPVFVGRQLKVPVRQLAIRAWLPPAIVGALVVPALYAVRSVVIPENVMHLSVGGLLSLAAAAPIAVLVGLNDEERRRFVIGPALRLKNLSHRLGPRSQPRSSHGEGQ